MEVLTVKKEDFNCCVCSDSEDLFDILEPYYYEDVVEIYATMISECFQIQLKVESENKNNIQICKNCIYRLRDAILLRNQVKIAYDRFQCYTESENMSLTKNINKKPNTNTIIDIEKLNYKTRKIEVEKEKYDENFFSMETTAETNETRDNSCNISDKNPQMEQDINLYDKKYICDTCNKGFKRKEHLRGHIKSHLGIKGENCDICDKSFVNKSTLARHLATHLGIKEKCEICNKLLSSKRSLTEHMKTHSKIRELICNYCEKTFKNIWTLRHHTKIHLNIKDFACDICNKAFSYKSSLRKHIYSHMDIRNEKCEICNKSFIDRKGLNRHLRVHSGIKEKCEICNRMVSSKHQLKSHMRIHYNNKKNVCGYCNIGFFNKLDLKRHIKSHSSDIAIKD